MQSACKGAISYARLRQHGFPVLMSATSRFMPALAGGVTGAALGVGALAVGGVFDEPSAELVTVAPASASAPAVRATPAAAGSLAALYEKTSTSVVEIRARGGGSDRPPAPRNPRAPAPDPRSPQPPSPLPDPRERDGVVTGSGFVVDADGTIVTNAHVVGESKDVNVGDFAMAIGNPFGLERTATAGIVSATGRQIDAPNGFSIAGAIQTDAPINPGNSGGPLLDGEGQVLGVTAQIFASGGANANVGIGFAVPATTVADVLPDLKAGKRIARPYLGISTAEPKSGDGALIGAIVTDDPGDDAGLRARDLVVQIDETEIERPEDVAAAIEGRKPGAVVKVTVVRGGDRRSLDVKLGTRPAAVP